MIFLLMHNSQGRGAWRAKQCHLSLTQHASNAQDFGARDPFPGEIATNFTEKSFGNENTEHLIKCDVGSEEAPVRTWTGGGLLHMWGLVPEKLRWGCFNQESQSHAPEYCLQEVLSDSPKHTLSCLSNRPPDGLASLVGLKNRKCLACEGGDVKPLTDSEAEKLRHQVMTGQIWDGCRRDAADPRVLLMASGKVPAREDLNTVSFHFQVSRSERAPLTPDPSMSCSAPAGD